MVRRALKEIPLGYMEFRKRLATVPVDAALGATAIWSGASAMFDASIQARLFNDVLPQEAAIIFNLAYIISGFAVIAGIGWNYRNIELSGWILILTSLVVRSIALWTYGGFNPFVTNSIIQALFFGAASITKCVSLLKRKMVILVDMRELETTGEYSVPSS